MQSNITNSIGMEFVEIQAGTFLMGSPESEKTRLKDEQQHQVSVPEFSIQTTPVTRMQYHDVLGEDPSHFKSHWESPVESVSWHDANRFIAALNKKEGTNAYRLPSESEWEYACRAGTTGSAYFDADQMDQYAWHDRNTNRTQPVRQKFPNAFGLFDMLGNAWEWCEDLYAVNYKPTDSGTLRVSRGGSWGYGPAFLRGASRGGIAPGNRISDTGLRLARTI